MYSELVLSVYPHVHHPRLYICSPIQLTHKPTAFHRENTIHKGKNIMKCLLFVKSHIHFWLIVNVYLVLCRSFQGKSSRLGHYIQWTHKPTTYYKTIIHLLASKNILTAKAAKFIKSILRIICTFFSKVLYIPVFSKQYIRGISTNISNICF